MTKNEENWQRNYLQLKEFVKIHGSLPNKKKVEKRGLLNWWKVCIVYKESENNQYIRKTFLDTGYQ